MGHDSRHHRRLMIQSHHNTRNNNINSSSILSLIQYFAGMVSKPVVAASQFLTSIPGVTALLYVIGAAVIARILIQIPYVNEQYLAVVSKTIEFNMTRLSSAPEAIQKLVLQMYNQVTVNPSVMKQLLTTLPTEVQKASIYYSAPSMLDQIMAIFKSGSSSGITALLPVSLLIGVGAFLTGDQPAGDQLAGDQPKGDQPKGRSTPTTIRSPAPARRSLPTKSKTPRGTSSQPSKHQPSTTVFMNVSSNNLHKALGPSDAESRKNSLPRVPQTIRV